MPSAHILVTRFAWLFLGDARLFRQPLSSIIFHFFTKKEIRLEFDYNWQLKRGSSNLHAT